MSSDICQQFNTLSIFKNKYPSFYLTPGSIFKLNEMSQGSNTLYQFIGYNRDYDILYQYHNNINTMSQGNYNPTHNNILCTEQSNISEIVYIPLYDGKMKVKKCIS